MNMLCFSNSRKLLWFWCQRYHKLPKLLDLVVLLSNLILTSGSDCTWGKRPWFIALGEIWWTPVDVDNISNSCSGKFIAQSVSKILSISCIVVYIYCILFGSKKNRTPSFQNHTILFWHRKLQESSGLDIAYQVFYWTVKSFCCCWSIQSVSRRRQE